MSEHLPTDRESPLIAGDAFYAAFKREPRSPSDAAWMNGYTAGRRSSSGAEAIQIPEGVHWNVPDVLKRHGIEYTGASRDAVIAIRIRWLEQQIQTLQASAASSPEPSEQLVEAMAELIYLRKYGKDGARWELNESKDVWRTQARTALGSVSPEPVAKPDALTTMERGHDLLTIEEMARLLRFVLDKGDKPIHLSDGWREDARAVIAKAHLWRQPAKGGKQP